jgi:flagellar hook protein FlgE
MGMKIDTSAITASYANLTVLGNNISNSNTVGFKSSTFQNILGKSIAAGTTQNFMQGTINANSNPLDVAINGNGFFKVQSASGPELYTRDGRFSLDGNNKLTNSTGDIVKSSTGSDISVPAKLDAVASSTADMQLNLDSNQSVPSTAFSSSDATSYNNSSSTTIYDAAGAASTDTNYFRKISANTWDVWNTNSANPSLQKNAATLSFNTNGNLSGTTATFKGLSGVTYTLNNPTQSASSFLATSKANGNPPAALVSCAIGGDGSIIPSYSMNNQNVPVPNGQKIGMFLFTDKNGLQPVGANQWAETTASGKPIPTEAGQNGAGTLQVGATEGSNVDMTSAMIDLLSAQRSFQAESQVINTESQIMQEVGQLGR